PFMWRYMQQPNVLIKEYTLATHLKVLTDPRFLQDFMNFISC
ncbi:MAG: hypothetical protein EZS28_041695, partial [Streblomastix strix]